MIAAVVALVAVALAVASWWGMWEAQDETNAARNERDALVRQIAVMERLAHREREAGDRLTKKHAALRHRFVSVLGEARAWRRRAIARGWTRADRGGAR